MASQKIGTASVPFFVIASAHSSARDDRYRACGETIEIFGSFGRKLGAGGETSILLAQDFDDRAASFRVETDFFGGGENS